MMEIRNPRNLSQRGRLSFLFRDAVLYGGAAAIGTAFSLVTFPVLTRYFDIEEFGVLDYFFLVPGFFSTIFIFGQDSAVARFFHEYEEEQTQRQLISQSFFFQMATLALLFPVLWLGTNRLTPFLIDAPGVVLLFRLSLLQLPFLMSINFAKNILKWTFARNQFLVISLGLVICKASLLIAAVYGLAIGIPGALVTILLVDIVFAGIGLFFIRRWIVRPREFRLLGDMLRFAAPIGLICIIGEFSPLLERTLTNRLLGAEDLSLYAAAIKISMGIGLFIGAFQTAWGPFCLSLYKQSDAGQTYNLVLKLFSLCICVVTVLMALVAHPLILILATEEYEGAVIVVFPLMMGLAIEATGWITEIGISISKRSHLQLYSYSAFVAVTLAGILLLAPALGLLGVGMAVMSGHVVKALLSSWLGQRAYPLPWRYRSAALVMTLTLLLGLTATWGGQEYGVMYRNLVLGATIPILLAIGWWVVLSASEREHVHTAIRDRLAVLLRR